MHATAEEQAQKKSGVNRLSYEDVQEIDTVIPILDIDYFQDNKELDLTKS